MFKNSRVYWPSADGLLTEAEVTFPVRDAWHKLAGRSDVRIYNPSLGGTYYVVKLSRYPPYNWDLGNLKYFRQVPQEAQSRRYLVRMAELRHPPLVGD